jgi:GcrA cell cycle regulator
MAAAICGKPHPKGLCPSALLILWVGIRNKGPMRPPQYMGFDMTNGWTDDRVAILKKLWTEGLSASQIAKQLGGVTRNAVIGKVHRLGLAGRAAPSRPVKRITVPIARVRPVAASTPIAAASLLAKAARSKEAELTIEAGVAPDADTLAAAQPPKPIKPKARVVRDGEIIGVLQLGPNMCKWPIGDPGDSDFGFCGSQCSSAAVYCEEHAAIAFQPAMARRPGVTRDDRAASEARRLARLANF